jgi:glycerol-3-phosphate dehydrogenase
MQRNLSKLANHSYDLLIVGGGIYGACLTWEAISRGLSVALVEKYDFGSATSANSLKIIHGGLRYLQHADFRRMRESIQERKNLLKIAPHLIHPLPILVPTYGHGLKGPEVMAIALWLNDLISCDRNGSIPDSEHHIAAGRILSKAECLAQLPGLIPDDLTGGACFCDAQVYNSERLTLAFLQSAHAAGAAIANHAKVTGFIKRQNRIQGAIVRDEITGESFEVQANLVVNTAGPWIHQLKELALQPEQPQPPVTQAKAVNLVVPAFIEHYAVGLSSRHQYRDQDAVLDKGSRFLFTAPWRGKTMVGTWYFPYQQSPDDARVTEAELQVCLDDINAAYPSVQLTLQDIQFVHCGLLPSGGIDAATGEVQLSKHYRVQDHSREGLPGLLTVSGVKYTTARDVAEKVINQVGKILRRSLPPSQTANTPLQGGQISHLQAFIQQEARRLHPHVSQETVQHLVYHYGSEYEAILNLVADLKSDDAQTALLAAQVRYAVRSEMALHLSDVVLRRTGIGAAGKPSDKDLEYCADIMAAELHWDTAQKMTELQQLNAFYDSWKPAAQVSLAAAVLR